MIKQTPKKNEFVIVWEFRVRSGKRREFEKVYGRKGVWAKFFASGGSYIRTELLRDPETPRRYLTIDFWTSRQAYVRFKNQHWAEYHAIDQNCPPLTETEASVGTFQRSR